MVRLCKVVITHNGLQLCMYIPSSSLLIAFALILFLTTVCDSFRLSECPQGHPYYVTEVIV